MPRSRSRPDHRDIGTGFILLAVAAGLIGGTLSLVLRLPPALRAHLAIAGPAWHAIALQHGSILVFFSAIPALVGGYGNWLVPPQVGARDTAFPRLAALSLCLAVAGFVLTLGSLLLGAPGLLLLLSIAVAAVALMLCAANLVATILNLRPPGLALSALAPFAWSQLVAGLLMVAALPVLLGALSVPLLRCAPAAPSLQPLFRLFGYPGFCIMILPGIGLVGDIVGRAARRHAGAAADRQPGVVVAMGVLAIAGFMGWARPMLAAGLPGLRSLDAAGPLQALAVILPVLAVCGLWLRTLRRGADIRALLATAAGLHAAGFVAVLLGGGADGLLTGAAFSPAQLHDVLSIATLFALFAGFFDHVGRMTGRAYPPALARVQFWLLAAGAGSGALPGPTASALGAALTSLSLLLFALIVLLTFVRRIPTSHRQEIGA